MAVISFAGLTQTLPQDFVPQDHCLDPREILVKRPIHVQARHLPLNHAMINWVPLISPRPGGQFNAKSDA
jgi:hypothetical protein